MKESSNLPMHDPFSSIAQVRKQEVNDVLWTKIAARLNDQVSLVPVSYKVLMAMLIFMLLLNIGVGWWKINRDQALDSFSSAQHYQQIQWNIYE
jgi:hypothetical protein